MSKFRFRLATLRKLRAIHRDEMQTKLTEASQAETMLRQQLLNLRDEMDSLQNLRRAALEGATSNVNQLLETQRYHSVLWAQESTMQAQASLLESEVLRRREALAEANRQVCLLDKLEQRQLNAHRQQLQRAETKELDEIASRTRMEGESWE